jgi:excisionase family DNA binding protein
MVDITRDELIRLADVADRLGVDEKTVKRWGRKGELEVVRVGKRPRTTWDAVNVYLNRESKQKEVVHEKPARKATPKGLKRSAAAALGTLKNHGMKIVG